MTDPRRAHRVVRERAAEVEGLRAEIAARNADLVRLQRERLDAKRTSDPRLTDPALLDLDAAMERASRTLARLRERLAAAAGRLGDATTTLGQVSDPRDTVAGLDGKTPLLLMPLRIETRFVDAELWVRIYPDQWAVDAFEPDLSEQEVANATAFWASLFRAGGDEGMRRAAWRSLVSTSGSGRAGWIIDRFAPLNPGDEPVRSNAEHVILAVAGDLDLTPGEQQATAIYWEAVWRGGGDHDGSRERDLRDSVGDAVADRVLALPPLAVDERPAGVDPQTAVVTVAICRLPAWKADDLAASSWTRAARANLLPDRILLLGFVNGKQVMECLGEPIPTSLVVGPDPAAAPSEQFRIEDGELVVPDELRWMVDFEQAIKCGMGMRVALDGNTEGGLDRLFAIGIRGGATPDDDQHGLEQLLTHHHRSRLGVSIVAQGTPTNNTEGVPSGFDRLDDADASYDRYLGGGGPKLDEPSWAAKVDGQWLAECLGIDPAVLGAVAGAAGTDQAEARAMNTALWPATWGYFLETMMHPLFGAASIDHARNFFVDYVSGRGRVPALRIGRQPYGILPTTALAKLRFGTGRRGEMRAIPDLTVLNAINRLLAATAADLADLLDDVPHAHRGGEPHQTLLDVVALHPASVEFHQRYAESIEDIFNRFRLDNLGGEFFTVWQALGSIAAGRQLLRLLGYGGQDSPDVLGKLFHSAQQRLQGPVIDDRPLSEEAPVRAYCDDGRNYLQWLLEAGSSSLEDLRQERGFSGDEPPAALLYVLLRHALLLSWWDAAERIRLDAGLIDEQARLAGRREPAFVHVSSGVTESRWLTLYDAAAPVTGDDRIPLHEVIPGLLGAPPTAHLAETIEAIARLAGLPTARLERVLAEHLDCCSHRVDAWRLGLVTRRLLDLRGVAPTGTQPARRGVHVGAYGWLLEVRREPRELVPVELPDAMIPAFGDKDAPALMRDSTNGGFVHAPSLNHAATAAILRSGFLANATPANPDTMAINLSSERMRLAVGVLQGLRNGQTLGALLGYRFERGLHDRHGLAEVDRFIHPLRLAFPADGDPDGRTTIDGLAFVRHVQQPGQRTYPFAIAGLPAPSSAQRDAIDAEVERLLDVHDAIADLVLAEGVHQAVLGNADRVAATLDAVGRGGFPPEPAVLETPTSGIALTHRFAVHLRTGLDHTASPVAGVAMTPRAMAEPGVNELVGALLPPPASVVAQVRWTERDGTERDRPVSQADLGLQPIDLLYLVRLESEGALGELDERIVHLVATAEALPPDVTPSVRWTERVSGSFTFFEVAPLVGHLRNLVTGARPLRASDVVRAVDASATVDTAVHADRARVADVADALADHLLGIDALAAEVDALLAEPVANRQALVDGAEQFAIRAAAVLDVSGRFGLLGSGWGQLAESRSRLLAEIVAAVAAVVDRWQPRLQRADDLLARDAALPNTATDAERIPILVLAEREVRAAPTDPIPTAAGAYRTAIDAQRAAFATKLDELRAIAAASTSVADAYQRVQARLPLGDFDAEPFTLDVVDDHLVDLCRLVARLLHGMSAQVHTRLDTAGDQLGAHDAAPPGAGRIAALTAAVNALLGADALFVPEFDLTTAQADEWEAAIQWRRSGGLLAGVPQRPFPIDDWLHGVARVRDRVRAWEQASLLATAAGRSEPELIPVQFPHASEPWLALEWPSSFTLAGERLLYTAHYPQAFDRTAPQAGLLVDEWVEVVPAETAATGIAFHYDSPDTEPPQAMLLVVPPDPTRGWEWDDVVAALHDTLDLARLRALEPDLLARTAYAQFLPATVSEATVRGLGISANLAVNNRLFKFLRADHA